ncbi:MAG TPA: hypothetical protein VMM59_10915 [Thermohalobaculum sp.]|nr:hypothetical protein [Thermohalobaculum sp.]
MSRPPLVLRAGASHLYPGARGSLEGALAAARTPCLVAFADGAAATATLAPRGDALILATAPYTTARGTGIAAKRWLVELNAQGFRVRRRA